MVEKYKHIMECTQYICVNKMNFDHYQQNRPLLHYIWERSTPTGEVRALGFLQYSFDLSLSWNCFCFGLALHSDMSSYISVMSSASSFFPQGFNAPVTMHSYLLTFTCLYSLISLGFSSSCPIPLVEDRPMFQ